MRLSQALSPLSPVREDLFALQAVAQFDFGYQPLKRWLSRAREPVTQLSIRRRWKGIAPLTVRWPN
jgi:hypothetical protein